MARVTKAREREYYGDGKLLAYSVQPSGSGETMTDAEDGRNLGLGFHLPRRSENMLNDNRMGRNL